MGTIYCIENIKNKKKYIGSTVNNCKERWKNHRNELKGNRHSNSHLQSAYNLYGVESFKYWIVEDDISDDILLDREAYWTKIYKTLETKYGYNITEELGGGRRKLSDESRQKMRDNHPDISGDKHPMWGKNHKEESKKRISDATSGENNPMYGKQHAEVSKQKMSDNRADINGSKNPFYGKRHTEENILKQKHEKASFYYIITSPTKETYITKNMNEFSRIFDLTSSHMSSCATGREKSHRGYTARYATQDEINIYYENLISVFYIKLL